jgi:hypothetical protein
LYDRLRKGQTVAIKRVKIPLILVIERMEKIE